jgi:hypothetical protein
MQWGLALQNFKASAVPLVLSGCVVAMKNPHALNAHSNYYWGSTDTFTS